MPRLIQTMRESEREFIGRFERRYHVVVLKRRRASEREREEERENLKQDQREERDTETAQERNLSGISPKKKFYT
jgi:hypothetical protein